MVYFTEIKLTQHYINEHSKDVPIEEVIEIIIKTKNPRKKYDCLEIEQKGYHILFKIEKNTIFLINAKKTK